MRRFRGRAFRDRDIVQTSRTYGDWPFIECECGSWLDKETGEHAVSVSLKDLLVLDKPKCLEEKKD